MKGADQCPRCGNGGDGVFTLRIRSEAPHSFCRKCETMWESFKVEDLLVPENEYSCFAKPCDNCAFRKGSQEREDPEKWEHLMQDIHLGGAMFYCHKGIPLADSNNPHESHVQPRREDGSLDKDKMRVCSGWLGLRLSDMRRELKASQQK